MPSYVHGSESSDGEVVVEGLTMGGVVRMVVAEAVMVAEMVVYTMRVLAAMIVTEADLEVAAVKVAVIEKSLAALSW